MRRARLCENCSAKATRIIAIASRPGSPIGLAAQDRLDDPTIRREGEKQIALINKARAVVKLWDKECTYEPGGGLVVVCWEKRQPYLAYSRTDYFHSAMSELFEALADLEKLE